MTEQSPDFKAYAREGWQLIKKDYHIVLPSALSFFAMMFVSTLMAPEGPVSEEIDEQMAKSLFTSAFISILLSSIAHGVTVGMIRELIERGSTSMRSAGAIVINLFTRLIGVSTISALLIMTGFILFLIPGFIAWLLVMFAMSALIMHGGSSFESIGRSIALVRANIATTASLFSYVMFANLFAAAIGIAFMGIPVIGQLITVVITSIVGAIVAVMEFRTYLALTGIKLTQVPNSQTGAQA